MKDFPNRDATELLHKKYSPNLEAYNLVFLHCVIVNEIAQQLIDRNSLSVNRELVTAGCLLHDIGVYRLYKNGEIDESNYIQHGILGEEILIGEGYSAELCRIASHHTGVGITAEDVEKGSLPLPHKDFLAETDEELLVMYADKFHSKTTPPKFNSPESYKNYVSRFGEEKVKKFEEMINRFGLPDLEVLSQKYGHVLV